MYKRNILGTPACRPARSGLLCASITDPFSQKKERTGRSEHGNVYGRSSSCFQPTPFFPLARPLNSPPPDPLRVHGELSIRADKIWGMELPESHLEVLHVNSGRVPAKWRHSDDTCRALGPAKRGKGKSGRLALTLRTIVVVSALARHLLAVAGTGQYELGV